mmetsp:Transcript_23447/g.20384  ORF Transcript_23447/g.20384 Transcript_23447/m.20384 type:complete len:88 (+) Transcript_23447:1741-2004(+)
MFSSHDDFRGSSTFTQMSQNVIKKGLALLRANSPKSANKTAHGNESVSRHFNFSQDLSVSSTNFHVRSIKNRVQSPTSYAPNTFQNR